MSRMAVLFKKNQSFMETETVAPPEPAIAYDPVNGKTINERLSIQMRVPKLSKGQEVLYKLIASDEDDLNRVDEKGRPLKHTQGYRMSGVKRIFDPFAGRTVTIENGPGREVSVETPLGKFKTKRPEPVIFNSDKPVVRVPWDKPELYAFMERADENRDNPLRNPRVKARFYRVDSRKKIMNDLEKNDFLLDAMNWVSKEASFKELIIAAEKVNKLRPDKFIRTEYSNEEASTAYELLKRELFALAQQDPQTIIKASTKVGVQIKMQIKDAMAFQLIMFTDGKNGDQRQWFHNDESLTTICPVELNRDKFEALIEFFASSKEGDKHYKKMVANLERVLNFKG